MKSAGLDPNQLSSPTSSVQTASVAPVPVSNFQKLFAGVSEAPVVDSSTPRQATPFIPAFMKAKVFDNAAGVSWEMNKTYFASEATTHWIANKYGTGEIRQTDILGSGGPYAADTKMFEVKLQDGRWVNAGLLAGYYERNPEILFPGLADKLIRGVLANA